MESQCEICNDDCDHGDYSTDNGEYDDDDDDDDEEEEYFASLRGKSRDRQF